MTAPCFEPVPRLPAHHLRGASLQDGPRLWLSSAFGGEVALSATVGGVHVAHVMRPAVARAVARELLAGADVVEGLSER